MARKFDIPIFYKSPVISIIKTARKKEDRTKKDASPSVLDLGRIRFKLARHFGFCYGVENAIEIAYRALEENGGKRVFLLSEMIHNPNVNQDLERRGIRFLQKTDGTPIVALEELRPEDVVIVPAFGTTVETFQRLEELGIDPQSYNTTCPFVEKVWNRSAQLGDQGYTVIIHGRHRHEETRATFSHARRNAPTLVIRDMEEAHLLASFLRRERDLAEFPAAFAGRFSPGFDPHKHLNRIGVVNQTTMLATETQAIARVLREAVLGYFANDPPAEHFADTRDTLCYATEENQSATLGLIEAGADLAIVVGGYNSSNTSHLVELLEEHMPAYYIKDAGEILDERRIRHLDLHQGAPVESEGWLPEVPDGRPLEIAVTAGASCPDALVDEVVLRIAGLAGAGERIEDALEPYRRSIAAAD